MKQNFTQKPASQDEMTVYCLMGEALCMIQHLEAALGHSITLKMNSSVTKDIADQILNKNRTYTLGKAIRLAQKENLYPPSLQNDLNDFLQQRNWLVHNAMFEHRNDLYAESSKAKLFQRIKSISNDARTMQHEIEMDMVNFCTSKGRDMSKILALINGRYERE